MPTPIYGPTAGAGSGQPLPQISMTSPAQAKAEAARAAYQSSPGAMQNYSDDAFLQWWAQSAATTNIEDYPADFALLTALADTGNPLALQTIDAMGYENTAPTEQLPVEQGIFKTALPGLLTDVEGDAARQAEVARLSGQARTDYDAARAAFSPEGNAARLTAELAQADVTAGALAGSAATAATEQLAALQGSVAEMKVNLTGKLAADALALEQQVAAFTANLNGFDATQKAALAEQIAANQRNLEASIGQQRQALATEIAGLRGAADAQSVARRAALETEIAGLTAAQAPMAEARLKSATALTTAVNAGLETTTDLLTAQRAKQGFVGGSSFDDANMARATIGARQQAAQVMGGARELNAADTRTIGARGATGQRMISDEYAAALRDIAGRDATGGRTLADTLAEGTRGIGDAGAAGTATIRANTGLGQMNIGNAGAAQTFQDKTVGSTELRRLLDDLAGGQAGIAATAARQQQTARDTGTTARQGYFDNAYTRGLAGTLAAPGLATNYTNTLTTLGNYGNTGLNRTNAALAAWATNPGTAPAPGTTAAVVDTSGNDIAGLGAGLLGSAFNAANAKNWWAKPKTTPFPDIYPEG